MKSADVAWARAVKDRDNWTCRRCGRWSLPSETDAHHIFTRSRRSTRHDLENGITLCDACHRWAHSQPLACLAWVETKLGTDAFEALRARSREMLKDEIDNERERVLEAQFEERAEARR